MAPPLGLPQGPRWPLPLGTVGPVPSSRRPAPVVVVSSFCLLEALFPRVSAFFIRKAFLFGLVLAPFHFLFFFSPIDPFSFSFFNLTPYGTLSPFALYF